MDSNSDLENAIRIINGIYPKDRIDIDDIKYFKVLKNDLILSQTILPIFFALVFLLFSFLGFFTISNLNFSVGFCINLIFLIFSCVIIINLLKKIYLKPQILLTSKVLYIVKSKHVDRYRLKAITRDISVSGDFILLKYRASFSQFSQIVINTSGINQDEIVTIIYQSIFRSDFQNTYEEEYKIVSKFSFSGLSSSLVSLIIGLFWTGFGFLLTYGGLGCFFNLIHCEEVVSNSSLVIGLIGLIFLLMGLYLFIKSGLIEILNGKSIYILNKTGINIFFKKTKRFIGWDQVKSISSINRVLGFNKLCITASFRRYTRTTIGPDHLFIYSSKALDEMRKFLKSMKKMSTS